MCSEVVPSLLAQKTLLLSAHDVTKIFDSAGMHFYTGMHGKVPFRVRRMPTSILARFLETFSGGIFGTTREKWIDGSATVVTIAYEAFFSKPSTFWELAAPFVCLVCFILAVRVSIAIRQVWQEISRQPSVREVESPILLADAKTNRKLIANPKPAYFRSKLMGVLILSLILLFLLCYLVRSAAIASIRTYIYLVPTSELAECQRRAFFVKIRGPKTLYNVEITLRDDKSGNTYSQTYSEIDPGLRSADTHFWFTPSSRWDESYTATVATRDSHSYQKLIIRGTQKKIAFATEVTTDEEKRPILKCRDALLPVGYTLATAEQRSCSELMKLPEDIQNTLDVYNYQRPDGAVAIRKQKVLPSPSELDEQSEDRHVTEYQQQIMGPTIDRYAQSRLLIYWAGGPKTKAYAQELRNLFKSKWQVGDPQFVPIGDERIIDLQITVGTKTSPKKVNDVLAGFELAGIKHRRLHGLDPDISGDVMALWVGPKSPKDASPDQCLPATLRPKPGQHHDCEMIAQAPECSFMP
jgi:hypothetical protein